MKNLKRFLCTLVLVSLAFSPLYSDVVLSDEEAAIVFQALADSENFTTEFLIQSNLWLEELATSSLLLKQSEEERKQLDKLWKLQLKEARQDKIKVAIITGTAGVVLGIIAGILIGVYVQ